ncbi:MAG TPA: BTAD domain-containing putative transcriptional regulator [Streptosporangiaceae bacterium]|nr:BTAD domain-containing putative transcriptional regulator [Streptosporangiaceae bacterium]
MSLITAQLPVRLTPLVGRESELNDIVEAVTRARLLTLTGPGGAGKTRLALAAARSVLESFPAGVCWVELAQIEDPEIVGQTVASRLGVPDTPGQDPAQAVAEYIADHQVLVVLDNCEHLAGATAGLTENLLGACPALTVLATSREALGVEGELNWQVPPLSLPEAGPGSALTASALAASDAVKLFEQRAQLVRPSFKVTDENAAQVASICQRLDGLPLAIELAAARMRILSSAQLAERLDDIFALLVGGARSAPARHQALRATLDWSHDMLDAEERVAFRRLAVFAGGFTLEAAERVTAGGDLKPASMLELLTRLADKSLLRVEHARGDSRYHLLVTIRDYARARLAEAGEAEPVRRAHLAYFTELVEAAAAVLAGGHEASGSGLELELDRLDTELPNLRKAFESATESGDAVAALRIAGLLDRYAYLRGRYHEIRQWMDDAVTSYPDAPAGLRAKALLGSGRLALLQCDYAPAVRRLEAALRLYRELEDPRGIAGALQVLGSVAREQGRYARAVELHAESLAVAEAAGDRWAVASAHSYLAFVSWLQRDFAAASTQASTALAMFRELGDVEGAAWSLISLGTVARYQGEVERAGALLTESRTLSEGIGFREGIAWCCEQLGLLAAVDGDPAAITLLRRSLELHSELRDRWRMSSVLEDLAAIALVLGRAPIAARLLGAAEALREAIGTVIAPCERAQHVQTAAGARAALGEETFGAARQQGLVATMEELTADLPDAALAAPVPAEVPPAASAPVQPAQAEAEQAREDQTREDQMGASQATGPGAAGRNAGAREATAPGAAGRNAGAREATAPGAAGRNAGAREATAPGAAGRSAVPRRVPVGALRVRALGGAVVEFGEEALTAADWGYAKPRELMFLLVSSPPMTKEQIAAALWPDLARQQLGNALHTALRELRRAVGDPGWVVYANGHYRFDRAREHECDVTEFEDALLAARRARPAEAALPHLQRAIGAYGGDFLDGMSAGEWALVRRDELRRAFESALLATGRLQTAAGRHQAAVTVFRRAVAHEPLNETAHRELMTSWARLGETARAVRHYEELTDLLRDQVGVPPAPETTALYRRLSTGA